MDENVAKAATPLAIHPSGSLVYEGIVVGKNDGDQLTINLGWAKAAGLKVKVLADPEVDRNRGGVVLDR